MDIAVIANYKKKETVRSVERLLEWAAMRKVTLWIDGKQRKRIPSAYWSYVKFLEADGDYDYSQCRFVLTVGGDGTLIRGAGLSAEHGIPIVGVNTGTLGFLAAIEPEDVSDRLDDLYWGRHYYVEPRLALAAKWGDRSVTCAINDIVLQKSSHGGLSSIDIYYGEEKVGHYRSDGLIVTTPTGSTAYAYAAGGPAIYPTVEALSILPICPQNRMNIPLTVGTDRDIRVHVRQGVMRILADGTDMGSLGRGELMTVHKAANDVGLIRFTKGWGILDWQEKVARL